MKCWNCAVTWESPETAPPDTIRVSVLASTVHTAAARALKLGQRQRPGKHYRSVVLLLERAEPDE
jgi:hypothetical protein